MKPSVLAVLKTEISFASEASSLSLWIKTVRGTVSLLRGESDKGSHKKESTTVDSFLNDVFPDSKYN